MDTEVDNTRQGTSIDVSEAAPSTNVWNSSAQDRASSPRPIDTVTGTNPVQSVEPSEPISIADIDQHQIVIQTDAATEDQAAQQNETAALPAPNG